MVKLFSIAVIRYEDVTGWSVPIAVVGCRNIGDAMTPINRTFHVTDKAAREWGRVKLRWQYEETFAGYLEPRSNFDQIRACYTNAMRNASRELKAEVIPKKTARQKSLISESYLPIQKLGITTQWAPSWFPRDSY